MSKYLQDKSLESEDGDPCNTCDDISKANPVKSPLSVEQIIDFAEHHQKTFKDVEDYKKLRRKLINILKLGRERESIFEGKQEISNESILKVVRDITLDEEKVQHANCISYY